MTTTLVSFIINYQQKGRSEGGPIVTRSFGSEEEARRFLVLLERSDTLKEVSNITLVKQTSQITVERII
jgi:hypothetical protein